MFQRGLTVGNGPDAEQSELYLDNLYNIKCDRKSEQSEMFLNILNSLSGYLDNLYNMKCDRKSEKSEMFLNSLISLKFS